MAKYVSKLLKAAPQTSCAPGDASAFFIPKSSLTGTGFLV